MFEKVGHLVKYKIDSVIYKPNVWLDLKLTVRPR